MSDEITVGKIEQLTSGCSKYHIDETSIAHADAAFKRISELEARVAELTADINWIERAARKGYMPRWSRHDRMWFINDEDAYQTFLCAIRTARKAAQG